MDWFETLRLSLAENAITEVSGVAGRIPGAIVILLLGWLILFIIKRMIRRVSRISRLDPTLKSLVISVVSFVGWVMVIAATLNALGLQQISLAVGGSVALVAMALATGLNAIPQDLLAGIFLISDDDFRVGYRVKAGGVEGIVERLSVRKTKIRSDDGQLHVIPNRNVDAATYVILAGKEGPPSGSRRRAG